ncbi:hypothetical protein TrVE_jg8946 [Triparma verrucosa]|uniref:Leucine-rich repeat domain-containing protein n=1 Tax=Triparma verrucosa TaxID=1606542 RepID=A0A9W6Z8S5_9STRA|nr:hypothetical protein TrVE_jg8946 [Triparma verrucosa]
MHTDDFRRLFVGFVMVDTLVAMRWLDKKWHKVVEKELAEVGDEPYGGMIAHGGNHISEGEASARYERINLVTKVVFLLNITKVGDYAYFWAFSLVVVDIPEGITTIGNHSFYGCSSLKDISLPKSLRLIGEYSFYECSSLEEVDLLHTNARELGQWVFAWCKSLREMKVPDSLQTFGTYAFYGCQNVVPSHVKANDNNAIVTYLRSIQ